MTHNQRERFIPFAIDRVPYYIDKVTDKILSLSELTDLTTSNYEKDEQRGYEDRMAGYYDKWYRYNRLDEGKAYDLGVQRALKESKCRDEIIVIPCMN